jgi:hypothetical protein
MQAFKPDREGFFKECGFEKGDNLYGRKENYRLDR